MTKLTDDLLNDNSGQYSDTDESNERTPLCPDGNMNTKLSHYTVPQCEGAYNSMEPSPPILTGKSTARIVSVDVDNTNHQSASSQEDSEDCSPSRVVYVDGLLGYQHMNGIIPAGANKLEGIDYERDIEVGNGSNDLNDAADGAASIEDKERWRDPGEETWYRIMLETSFPFFSAGMGMVFAGVVLGVVQHWPVFTDVSEIFILVPALLGLKGNLEMTLASRLSTQANLGNMDTSREQWKMIAGNLALTQAQAIVVGFLASIAAMIFGWIPEGKFSLPHAFLLCSSSVMTASIASFILGSVMIVVVIFSRKCHINPDNVATPIAASLGDLTTLTLLSVLSSVLYKAIGTQEWLAPVLMCAFLALTPIFCVISHKNTYVHDVLYTGWTPVIGAMVISSMGGLILDFAVGIYHGIAVFQPVVNGVGGNLVAVQASRLSTSLHRAAKPGQIPPGYQMGCPNPLTLFFGKGINGRTVRVLMLMVIPGHLIFMYTIHFMEAGHTTITLKFAVFYLLAAIIQVALLLYISMWMVHFLWKRGNDPDNFSIPYLTALGDLLGTGLLALAFHILYMIGDKDSDIGD